MAWMDRREEPQNIAALGECEERSNPLSTAPMTLPVMETTAPALMSVAPAAPMDSRAASASGVVAAGRSAASRSPRTVPAS